MEPIHSGSTKIYETFGLENVEIEPYENADSVRKDPEFWKDFVESQALVFVKGRKKLGG